MRHRSAPVLTTTTLLLIASWARVEGIDASGDEHYRFEPQPRAILAPVGVASSRDPTLAVRASGALYLLGVYGEHDHWRLGLFISHDGGDTVAPPVPISQSTARVSSHRENSPSLALGQTEVYALWEQHAPKGGTDLMFARSLMFGHRFEDPIRVTDKTAPSFNGFSALGVAPDGVIYAAWLDGRDPDGPPGTFTVYLATSTDRGATFGTNVRVAAGACPCCRPGLAFGSKGEVFLSWRHVFEDQIRDIVAAVSLDQGKTFAAPVRVAEDNWRINGCPHSGPAMAWKDTRLYVAWYTAGDSAQAGVQLSWSDDGGKSFAPPVKTSGQILDANHPALSVSDDGRTLLVFQGRDPVENEGWAPARPYLVEISDTGEASPPVLVPGSRKGVSGPTVAAGSAGRVFIAWTESSNIMLSRGRKVWKKPTGELGMNPPWPG